MTPYVERLDAAWADHLAPRSANAPTVISTFAGCGGSSLGYSMAGYRELLAVEWDDNAVETFRLNFPDVPVYHGDIAKLSVEDALARAGLAVGDLDVFDGSPPCQGFSTIGRRIIDDPRNVLFREYIRLLRGLQPRVFVMENVPGMVQGKMKKVFAEIIHELKMCGYNVSARMLNASYFEVPQSRRRIIFIGVRNDIQKDASHPKPTSKIILKGDEIVNDMKNIRIVSWRNAGGDNTLRPLGALPTGIARRGIPLEDGTFYNNPEGLKTFFSFPKHFKLCGANPQKLYRIANSVPPLFMRAIAEHIRYNILAPTTAQEVAD